MNLSNILKLLSLLAALVSVAGAQGMTHGSVSPGGEQDGVKVASPDGRYVVRFLAARSDGKDEGKLWGAIAVRDLSTGRERTIRSASGHRGAGVFQGFSVYEDSDAWSPDGLYLAYYEDSCIDEPGVQSGVVCQLHEIRFLQLKPQSLCGETLTLSRYGFGGWVRHQAHTVWEIDADGRKVKRNLCARGR